MQVVVIQDDGVTVPSPNTQVAFDRPDGTRQELMTDASGSVTFTSVDWAPGSGALTAYRPGYTLVSRTNLDARVRTIELPFFALPRTTQLRGNLRNARPGAVRNWVSSSGALGGLTMGTMFEVNVPVGEPFQLVAFEGLEFSRLPSGRGYAGPAPLRWSELTHAAVSAAGREDIDLATTRPLSPTAFRVTYTPPAALAAQLSPNAGALAFVNVRLGGGVSTYTSTDRPRPDGPFEVAAEFVRPTGVGRFLTLHLVAVDINNDAAGTSMVLQDGVPMPTASIGNFLPIPELGDVPFPTTAHTALPVRAHAPGVPVHGTIGRGPNLLWYVDIGPEGTVVRFPALPSRAVADPALQGGGMRLSVRSCEIEPRTYFCRRTAATESYELSGPL